jgi:hypothetical protein
MDFRRPRETRYTHEDQQTLFPTNGAITAPDLGLEFVNDIQEKPIYWGNSNATQATNWDSGDETSAQTYE